MKILKELLEEVSVLESHGNVDVSVSSVSLSSKNIEQNSLFVALVGNVVNGHDFIDEVIENGAKVIIHEEDVSNPQKGITYIKVANTHKVVGTIASNFYDKPSHKLKLVGVTGTNGKTTTATLLHKLFMELGFKAGMIGTVFNKINDQSIEAERTTPDAITLNKLLADMVDAGCEYCFMEVSSHSVSEGRISGLMFAGGIFTNLTLDHLDYHKTLENYRDAKRGFFEALPGNAFALTNIDDDNGRIIVKTTKAKKYAYGLKNESPVGLVDDHQSDWCGIFNERLETKLIGEFNAYNVLAVYAAAVILEQDENRVKEIIKNLEPVPGRFQYVKNEKGITGIVDYAHTPDALENVLKTINSMKDNHKIITVVGAGGDRDKSKRPIMARLGYEFSDVLILTSDNPRTEKPEEILSDMHKGVEDLPQDKVDVIVDRHEAILKACSLASRGDFILVAGKGHENYQEVNGIKTHFDDLEELEKSLG